MTLSTGHSIFLTLTMTASAVAQAQGPHFEWTGSNSFGQAVNRAGDVDGDGHDDIVVGAPGEFVQAQVSRGIVRVYSGATGQLIYAITGDPFDLGSSFGIEVDGVGDVNADGFGDFAVGIAGAAGQPDRVRVYSGADGSVWHTFVGGIGEQFGASLSGAGDVDNDGFDDILIGAHGADSQGTNAGEATIYSGADGSVLATIRGQRAYQNLGLGLAFVDDLDGDGFDNFIVGSYYDGVAIHDGGRPRHALERVRGAPCIGGNGRIPRIGWQGHALLGQTTRMTLRGAAPSSPGAWIYLGFATELPLDVIGLDGCTLYVDPFGTVTTGTDALGMAGIDVTMPRDPGTLGLEFTFQWAIPDLGAPHGLPIALSDSLTFRIGTP